LDINDGGDSDGEFDYLFIAILNELYRPLPQGIFNRLVGEYVCYSSLNGTVQHIPYNWIHIGLVSRVISRNLKLGGGIWKLFKGV